MKSYIKIKVSGRLAKTVWVEALYWCTVPPRKLIIKIYMNIFIIYLILRYCMYVIFLSLH